MLDELDPPAPPPPPRPLDRFSPLLAEIGLDPRRLMLGGVVVVVLIGVGVAALWPRSAAGRPPEDSLPVASSAVAPATTSVATEVVVHVAGQVVRPGVYRLESSARVDDAITAAGGLAPQADGARVNLAAPVADGERVYVPAVGQAVPTVAVGETTAGPTEAGAPALVDLNTASLEELDTLPGVGPATAQAIIDHRDQNGPFTSVDQLLDVRGIGDAKLADLRDQVSV